MKLWYINLGLDSSSGYDIDYCYQFKTHTRFISNFLSKQMRKKVNWFETDGTFNMISVDPMPNTLEVCKIVPIDALTVPIPFDKERYENIKDSTNYDYYLELLEEGFKKAAKYKEIPLANLLTLIDDFKKNGCKNEWLHKRKRFKEQDIEVILTCHFTTFDFRLVATINKISTKEELCSGTVLKTDSDEICYDKEFKDVFVIEKEIIITDWFDLPRFLINLMDVLDKKFNCKLLKRKL